MSDTAAKTGRIEGGWLLSPSYDLTLILGVLAVAVTTGLVVAVRPDLFVYALLTDLWLLGYHHVISTFTKLAGTKEDRAENRFLLFQLPFIVLAVTAGLAAGIGIWVVISVYFFWQWYHYVRQSYGIATFYMRKQSTPAPHPAEERALNNLVVWSVPIWGVLYRCYQGWDQFLFHDIWLPAVPLLAVQVAGTVAVVSTVLWILTRVLAWQQGRLSLAHTLFVASHICAFYVGYIVIDNINIGWLTANIWHNAQYVLFVWLYNTNRFKDPDQHKGTVMAYLSQRRFKRIFAYFAFCLLATTVVYGSLAYGFKLFAGEDKKLLTLLYVMAFQTVNFHHYVVDSLIWKARHKKNRAVLEIKD